MKHKILICILGVLLMFALTAAVSGERSVETVNAIDRHTAIVEHSMTVTPTNTTVEPNPGSTIVTTAGDFPVSYISNAPDAYSIPWQSINSAGGEMTSTGYQMLSSVGQGVIGYATSSNYAAGIGYLYGLTAGSDCDCDNWGSVNGDVPINPVDVVFMVNFVYKNIDQITQHANCPNPAGDVTCDGNVNPVDVVFYVNFVYKNIDGFCADPCSP